jgi:hypothetical protein
MIGLYRACAAPSATQVGRRALHKSTQLFKAATDAAKAAPKPPQVPKPPVESSSMTKVLSFPKDHPFAFQLMVATTKTSVADLLVQLVAEGKSLSEVDWKRNGIFVAFGFTYLGGFQWWLMVHKYRQWFPTMDRFAKLPFAAKLKDTAGMLDAGRMVLFDIFVHMPIMYFPAYYSVKEFVSGEGYNPLSLAKDGVSRYINNAQEDLTAMVKLWGPSDCVQFVLPLHIRMPFRHMVSFFWTAYVSFTRGSIEEHVAEPIPAPVAE